MTSSVDLLVIDDVLLTRNERNDWHYLALQPHPQRSPDGTPMASLIEAGATGLLALSAQLDPTASTFDAITSRLTSAAPSRSPLTLQSAVVAVVDIVVTVTTTDGRTDIAHSTGSGYPPHTAVFQLAVNGAVVDAARAALGGERGHLAVTYVLDTVHGSTRASADLGDWFPRHEQAAGPDAPREQD